MCAVAATYTMYHAMHVYCTCACSTHFPMASSALQGTSFDVDKQRGPPYAGGDARALQWGCEG